MKFSLLKRGRNKQEKLLNYEGEEAFLMDDESTLLNLVSTCMMNEPKFYGEPGEVEEKIFELSKKIKSKYLLQLASYTRQELYLRSVPMFLLSISSYMPETKEHVREYSPKIIQRADELYESVACYLELYGKPIPNSLKKGIKDSFVKFDEYQFAKYNRKTEVGFKDVIMLTHPKKPPELIKKILDDKLKTPMTWEVEISTKGNKPEVWENLITSKKLPYMATLRNLRNLLTTRENGISDEPLDQVIAYIKDEKAVKKSKQFPFRFFSAYRELEEISHPRTSEVLDALEEAITISYENIPYMKGTTLIACDVSGSMQHGISRKSKLQLFDIGLLLGAATHKYTDKSITGFFGDKWKVVALSKKGAGIISNTLNMHKREGEVGYSTNGYKVIEYLNKRNTFVDRILIFTDCQLWNTDTRFRGKDSGKTIRKEYQQYLRTINPETKLYLFNLNGYGNVNFPEQIRSVVNINGWSDKVLQFIQMNEIDPKAQVNYIKESY
jgi:hypothetical protein